MEYKQALDWVHNLGRVALAPGLERMRSLMAALGNPQRRLCFVHVAGTNGKGSTVAMAASVLKTAGYRTGANISPYVLDFRERFQINGAMIGEEELTEVLSAVKAAAETLPEPPLEFEAVTAAAFLCFAREKCDIVCLETGIGGEHDKTNVVENTLVACLLHMGYDHTELLGETLREIAQEKCGIIKPGCTVVSYPAQPKEAAAVIQKRAARLNCPLVVPAQETLLYNKEGPFRNCLLYKGLLLSLPFAGKHQAYNTAVVVETTLALRQKGFLIADKDIIDGIEAATSPARIEVMCKAPLIILDGAHNVDSARALADTLKDEGVSGLTLVMGMLRDKQVAPVLRLLAPYAARLYAVKPESPRALCAGELAEMAGPLFPQAVAFPHLEDAILRAAQGEDGVLVCGSFYLAAQARGILLRIYGNGEKE